jgi:hypothetical protein
MRPLRMAATGAAMLLSLMVPRTASAGMAEVVDYIIGLTGPAMLGIPIACEFDLRSDGKGCYVSPILIKGPRLADTYWQERRFWASLGGGVYFSTGKDSEMREFSPFDVGMLAFEPTFNVRSVRTEGARFVLEHGAGASVLYVFGDGFSPFVKGGIKLRPVGGTLQNVIRGRYDLGVAYNLRIFPNPFTAADFGVDSSTTTHGGREFAHGITVTLGF